MLECVCSFESLVVLWRLVDTTASYLNIAHGKARAYIAVTLLCLIMILWPLSFLCTELCSPLFSV
jgi:hypothetical protein